MFSEIPLNTLVFINFQAPDPVILTLGVTSSGLGSSLTKMIRGMHDIVYGFGDVARILTESFYSIFYRCGLENVVYALKS